MTVTPKLTDIDDAILEHAAAIVFSESRPFSFKDFISFEVGGKVFALKLGTIRNHFSTLHRLGKIQPTYNSGIAFYTLPGHNFTKQPVTPPPRGGQRRAEPIDRTIERDIQRLTFDQQALHDIRLQFPLQGIWTTLSSESNHRINPSNKDLTLQPRKSRDGSLEIRIVIHKTDNVSVYVACSSAPIVVDYQGVLRLSNELTRIEDYLDNEIRKNLRNQQTTLDPIVPYHLSWTLKQYHLGRDSIEEYDGERFNYSYDDLQGALVRVYAKRLTKQKTVLRLERQESENRPLVDVINEFLDRGQDRK